MDDYFKRRLESDLAAHTKKNEDDTVEKIIAALADKKPDLKPIKIDWESHVPWKRGELLGKWFDDLYHILNNEKNCRAYVYEDFKNRSKVKIRIIPIGISSCSGSEENTRPFEQDPYFTTSTKNIDDYRSMEIERNSENYSKLFSEYTLVDMMKDDMLIIDGKLIVLKNQSTGESS